MNQDENAIQLTKTERLLLANQFKILEKLYPEEANYYAQTRKAIEEGYALSYELAFEGIYEEMSAEECLEVIDILDMYRAITFSYAELSENEKTSIKNYKFKGFDGNNEVKQFRYTKYFISHLNRFEELKYGGDYLDVNSHAPKLEKYRQMLALWKGQLSKSYELDKEAILALLQV